MYDEETDHYLQSLQDVWFLKEVCCRTGMLDELDNLGWGYGMDWNGGWEKEDYQYNVLFQLLAPGIGVSLNMGESGLLGEEPDSVYSIVTGEPAEKNLPIILESGDVLQLELQGSEDDLKQWAHFLHWLYPKFTMLENVLSEEPHVVILLELWELMTLDVLEIILKAWEVMTYYDNIANADAWRELRGHASTDNNTGQSADAGSRQQRREELQNGGVSPTVKNVGQVHRRRAVGEAGPSLHQSAAAS